MTSYCRWIGKACRTGSIMLVTKGSQEKIKMLVYSDLTIMTYNCVTDTVLGSVLRYGATTFVAGAGETLHLDVGKRVPNVELKYTNIVLGSLAAMTAPQITVVDVAEAASDDINSVGALEISRVYVNEAALPAVPAQAGLVVIVTSTAGAVPGLAVSVGGAWMIFESR